MQSENSVAFKVFVQRGKDAPEVRRFAIDKGVVASFEYLKAKLISVFPSIKNSPFTISWKDDEGDEVVISSDEELILALSSIQEDLKKLFVKANKPKSDEPPKEKAACFAAAGEFPVGFAVAGGMPPCFPPPGMAPCFQPPGGMPGCFPNHGGMVGCFPPQGPMPGCFGPPGEVPPNNAPSGGLMTGFARLAGIDRLDWTD